MEEISGVQHHVDIVLFCQAHHFVERLPAIVFAVCITLVVPDMTVRRDKNTDCICIWSLSAFPHPIETAQTHLAVHPAL